MSPVEIRGTPRYVDSFAACVPLPAPGGPRRTRRMRVTERTWRSKDLRLGRSVFEPCGWATRRAAERPIGPEPPYWTDGFEGRSKGVFTCGLESSEQGTSVGRLRHCSPAQDT